MFHYKKFTTLFLCLVLFNTVTSWPMRKKYKRNIRQLIDLIKRRNTLGSDESIIDVPESVEDLPEAEPIKPGHTLLQPSFGMLKSSVKYPHKDVDNTAVYGNLNNLGITYGKTNGRVLYTGFRKANDLLIKLLKALDKKSNIRPKKSSNNLVIIELDPLLIKNTGTRDADYLPEIKNTNAMEILDDPSASNEEPTYRVSRRQRHPRYSKYRDRNSEESSAGRSESSSSESESSDYEHNPGNPYTVHKDKYRQNWLWNHFMDGNHMNVNPYAPPFNSIGPSGASLFFGRKWWYFNQDDFKPLN